MNTETGVIITQKDIEQMDKLTQAKCVPIDEAVMTLKQFQSRKVSLFDNRSQLSKIRIQHRNSLRNKPCPCGSGIKFKHCCWDKIK